MPYSTSWVLEPHRRSRPCSARSSLKLAGPVTQPSSITGAPTHWGSSGRVQKAADRRRSAAPARSELSSSGDHWKAHKMRGDAVGMPSHELLVVRVEWLSSDSSRPPPPNCCDEIGAEGRRIELQGGLVANNAHVHVSKEPLRGV